MRREGLIDEGWHQRRGRMGRLSLRAAKGGVHRPLDDPRAGHRLDVVHINEIKGGAAATAHLLEFDSVHGRWRETMGTEGETAVAIAGKRIGFSSAQKSGDVAWGDLGCDVVLECTGKFSKPEDVQPYFDRGVQTVIVAAPVNDDRALNIVVGVNDTLLVFPARASLACAIANLITLSSDTRPHRDFTAAHSCVIFVLAITAATC
jgi:glyceraldehyde-3-phosphate dehydrogenase/erythrose-4-phosphate dehydrogenase